jgi:hypothetical protein
MRLFRFLPVLALPSLLFAAPTERSLGELHYRVRIHFRGDAAPSDARFILHPTPVIITQNRVQKPRLGGWRLEGVQRTDGAFSMAAVLARVERMLYLAGPAPGTEKRPIVVTFNGQRCPLWHVQVPEGLPVYAYLAEVAPNLLALSYLSGSFPKGDLASLEIQLESFRLAPGAGPAEDGTALLKSLQRMALESAEAPRADATTTVGMAAEFVHLD